MWQKDIKMYLYDIRFFHLVYDKSLFTKEFKLFSKMYGKPVLNFEKINFPSLVVDKMYGKRVLKF